MTKQFRVRFAVGVSEGDFSSLGQSLAGKRVLVITSPTVNNLYGSALKAGLKSQEIIYAYHVVQLGERRKKLETVKHICEAAAQFGLDRKGAMLAIGGGVCTDVVTLSASLVRRGIEHFRIPTTLVGQIDAGIGIKGGVNLSSCKNIVGCFHPPAEVIIDKSFLRSLNISHIRQGLAEILKMALIADRALFEDLRKSSDLLMLSKFQQPEPYAQQILSRAIQLMLYQLSTNPYENKTLKRFVDMGHTFSPLLETASGFRIAHGEAVAVDMALCCLIAQSLGLMKLEEAEAFIRFLWHLGLPIFSPLLSMAFCKKALEHAMLHRGGQLNLVIPLAIGEATFIDYEPLIGGNALSSAIGRLAAMDRDFSDGQLITIGNQNVSEQFTT
jgi:3-dehydroquinate synthase